jgi:hypothetical protein
MVVVVSRHLGIPTPYLCLRVPQVSGLKVLTYPQTEKVWVGWGRRGRAFVLEVVGKVWCLRSIIQLHRPTPNASNSHPFL